MSDDLVDQNEQTRSAIERLLPKAVAELEEMVDNGGTRTVRITCEKCAHRMTQDIKVADADLLVKAVSALSSALPRMQSKDDAHSQRAAKILADLSELTSAELAEYITQLEAQLDG